MPASDEESAASKRFGTSEVTPDVSQFSPAAMSGVPVPPHSIIYATRMG